MSNLAAAAARAHTLYIEVLTGEVDFFCGPNTPETANCNLTSLRSGSMSEQGVVMLSSFGSSRLNFHHYSGQSL